VKARLDISSETVKPIPATAPAAASSGPLTGGRGPCNDGRDAIHEAPVIPSGLPTMYPRRMPSVIGDLRASPISVPVMCTPPFASANSGTIT
jgi:hypothetical protein